MSGHEYDVSDVLWIIRGDRPGMLALQVVEVITKKTIQGEQTQYLVVSATNPNRTVLLHTIEGRLFRDIEKARQALYTQANKAIDNIVDKVKQSADEAFQQKQPDALDFMKPTVSSEDEGKIEVKSDLSEPQFKQKDIPENEKDQYQEVEMDGRTVKIKLPDL